MHQIMIIPQQMTNPRLCVNDLVSLGGLVVHEYSLGGLLDASSSKKVEEDTNLGSVSERRLKPESNLQIT